MHIEQISSLKSCKFYSYTSILSVSCSKPNNKEFESTDDLRNYIASY
jgi:hypothetical protein